jgi:ferredoxin
MPLNIEEAELVNHNLRVCMLGYERTKFAWSNYNGAVQLYLQTDPLVVDEKRCIGCGVCARFCPEDAIRLKEADRIVRIAPPRQN